MGDQVAAFEVDDTADEAWVDTNAAAQSTRQLPGLARTPRLGLLVLASAVLQGALLIPVPLAIKDIFDRSIPDGDSRRLMATGLLLIVLVTMSGGVAVALRHAIGRMVQEHLADVRRLLADHLIDVPLAGLRQSSDEKLRDLIVQDTLRYSTSISTITAELVPSGVTAVAVALVLLLIDPPLFGLAALLMVPLVLFNRLLSGRVHHHTDGYHTAFRHFGSSIATMLDRAPVTRVHGAQQVERAHQFAQVEELRRSAVELDRSRSLYTWALQSVIVGSAMMILVVGGLGVVNGTRSLGELFAFYAAIALIRPALDAGVRAAPTLMAGRAARSRLDHLVDSYNSQPHPGHVPVEFSGRLVAKDLVFSYGDRLILDGVDLVIEPGTVSVLRGPNGAGKTTLVNLICGLLPPSGGVIEAEGLDLSTVDLRSFRRSIGVVFQEALLAGTTIRGALAYGDHELDDVAINHALAVTKLDAVVARLPHGIETEIGPEGLTLSGGERQRLAIAQALVRKPRLLVLDEPTNHLDAVAVASVVNELVGTPDGPAVLIVTHEESNRFSPDQIIELKLTTADEVQAATTKEKPMSSEALFRRADGTVELEVDEHTVVVDRNGEQMVTLNSVGGLIWDRLVEPASVPMLVGACAAIFPTVPEQQLVSDVRSFVDSAVDVGVVVHG